LTGSGATLAVPGPVGGVVAGCTAGATREAEAEAEAAEAAAASFTMVVAGAGGARGTSDGGMVPWATVGDEAGSTVGSTTGAGLGTAVWSSFLSSAYQRWATRHCGRAARANGRAAGRAARIVARRMLAGLRMAGMGGRWGGGGGEATELERSDVPPSTTTNVRSKAPSKAPGPSAQPALASRYRPALPHHHARASLEHRWPSPPSHAAPDVRCLQPHLPLAACEGGTLELLTI
jgi:hypothetical protein